MGLGGSGCWVAGWAGCLLRLAHRCICARTVPNLAGQLTRLTPSFLWRDADEHWHRAAFNRLRWHAPLPVCDAILANIDDALSKRD